MGLDLIVKGCAKPGYEQEWRRLLERSFSDAELSKAEAACFQEICIPGYERIGAPRVGHDNAANRWILEARKSMISVISIWRRRPCNPYTTLLAQKCKLCLRNVL